MSLGSRGRAVRRGCLLAGIGVPGVLLAGMTLLVVRACDPQPPDVAADARSPAAMAARAAADARMDRVLAMAAIPGAEIRTVSVSDTCSTFATADSFPAKYFPTSCGLSVTRMYGFDGAIGPTMRAVDHGFRATGWTVPSVPRSVPGSEPSMAFQLAHWHVTSPAEDLTAVVYRSGPGAAAWVATVGWARAPEPLQRTCERPSGPGMVVIRYGCADLAGALRSVLAAHRYAMELTVTGGYYSARPSGE